MPFLLSRRHGGYIFSRNKSSQRYYRSPLRLPAAKWKLVDAKWHWIYNKQPDRPMPMAMPGVDEQDYQRGTSNRRSMSLISKGCIITQRVKRHVSGPCKVLIFIAATFGQNKWYIHVYEPQQDKDCIQCYKTRNQMSSNDCGHTKKYYQLMTTSKSQHATPEVLSKCNGTPTSRSLYEWKVRIHQMESWQHPTVHL